MVVFTSEMKIAQFRSEHQSIRIEGLDICQFTQYKQKLLESGMIGKLTDEEPVELFRQKDYGNISMRIDASKICPSLVGSLGKKKLLMLISGSQSSSLPASLDNCVVVYDYDPDAFLVRSYGVWSRGASSETPMHWSAYEADSSINAIIHGHIVNYNHPLIDRVRQYFKLNDMFVLETPSKYSSQIGFELVDVLNSKVYAKKEGINRIIGLDNHDGGFGILSLGKDMKEAYDRLNGFYCDLTIFCSRK